MKKFFGNISLAVVLNLAIKSLWILVDNKVQDEIGHEVFGSYSALFSLGFLFLAFADLGINQYATKTLAPEQEKFRTLFPSLFSLKLFLAVAYPVVMIGVGFLLGYRGNELVYLFLLCGIHAVIQVIAFFRGTLQAFQRFRVDAIASVLDRALLLGIVLGLLWFEKIDLDTYIYARLVSTGVVVIFLYFFMIKLFGWIRPKITMGDYKGMIKAAFPFAVMTILYSVNDRVDQVMLERLIGGDEGKHETGLYAGAYRWVDATMMYLWTVLPIFFARFALYVKDFKEQQKLLEMGQVLAALPMIFMAVFVFFYGDKLLFLFGNSTPAELETMSICLKILFISVLTNGFFAVYSTLLTSTGHERIVSYMIAAGIAVNIILNAIFIPEYGAVAAAWNTLASYALLSVGYLIYITVKLPVSLPWGTLLRLILVGGAFAGAFYGLTFTGWVWYLNSAIAGVVLLGMAWGVGLFGFLKRGE